MSKSYFCFNQNGERLLSTNENELNVFLSYPFKKLMSIDFQKKIKLCETLNQSNLFLIVFEDDPQKMVIWNDKCKKNIVEIKCSDEIKTIKFQESYIITTLKKKVYVYKINDLTNITKVMDFETHLNPKGVITINTNSNHIIAFPDIKKGVVTIVKLGSFEVLKINAHENEIAYLTIDNYGTKLATASIRGTIIRIFDIETGKKLQEVRRGSSKAIIYDITFNDNGSMLCVSSNKGTIHIFNCNNSQNKKSSMAIMGGYFKSEWSFAKFDGMSNCLTKCKFINDDNIIVATENGLLYELEYNKTTGDCERKKVNRFIN